MVIPKKLKEYLPEDLENVPPRQDFSVLLS